MKIASWLRFQNLVVNTSLKNSKNFQTRKKICHNCGDEKRKNSLPFRPCAKEFDARLAVPFGFYNTTLNLGISPVCTLGGPTTLWGFKTRGLGPTELRRQRGDESNNDSGDSSTRDFIGGDLAITAFADLSSDLPIRWLREQGIHAHIFAGSGNVAKLTQNEYMHFSPRKFLDSFRLSVGCGICYSY